MARFRFAAVGVLATLLLGLSVTLAHAKAFSVGGVALEFPQIDGICAADETDQAFRPRFASASAAQARVGNQLRIFGYLCDEAALASGQAAQQLGEWVLVYNAIRLPIAPSDWTQESASREICERAPGLIDQGEAAAQASNGIKEIYGIDVEPDFANPQISQGYCILPVRAQVNGVQVLGLTIPFLAGRALVFISSYTSQGDSADSAAKILRRMLQMIDRIKASAT